MPKMNRTQYSIKNIFFGLSGQIVDTLLRFVGRTIFIKYLEVEYLGINGLFSEILTVLSLAELGIGSAIVYALYKPLSQNDTEKISSLMKFYKKCYIYIGIIVAIVGVAFLPFLDIIVKKPENISLNLNIIYGIFLFDTSISYFFSYKTSLLNADQKNYILQILKIVGTFVKTILQITVIVLTQNFYIYLTIQIAITLANNIYASIYVDKKYPYLKNKNAKKLDKKTFKELVVNVRSLVVIRISSILVNSTDNLIISSFKGLKAVGLLSNYTLIVQVFETLLSQIFNSLTGSIGNLNAEGDTNKSEKFFKVLNLMNFWLYGFITVSIVVLGNDVIYIWLGDEYLLPKSIVVILACNFYVKGMQNAVWNYKNTYGLFKYGRYLLVMTAIINLVLSLFLGNIIGIAGVLVATSISRLCTNVWYEPYAVYKYGLKSKVIDYYKSYIKYAIVVFIVTVATYYSANLLSLFGVDNMWLITLYKCVCVLIIPNILILFTVYKTEEYNYLKNKIKYLVLNKGK